MKRRWIGLVLAALLVADQITKIWARGFLKDHGPFSFLGDWVHFETVENPGAFLSLGASWSEGTRQIIFHFGVIAVLAFTSYLLWKHRGAWWSALGLVLILAGGAGNLIDRLMKGTVTDFLILGISWFRTGVVNIADMAIVFGLVFLLIPEKKESAS